MSCGDIAEILTPAIKTADPIMCVNNLLPSFPSKSYLRLGIINRLTGFDNEGRGPT